MADELISFEPATGAELWRGAIGDVDAEVAVARGAWASWAAQPLAVRAETLRRAARAERDARAQAHARRERMRREAQTAAAVRTGAEHLLALVERSLAAAAVQRAEVDAVRAEADAEVTAELLLHIGRHLGKQYGFPTRTELDDVHRTVTELRRELRALRREMRTAQQPAAPVPVPAPEPVPVPVAAPAPPLARRTKRGART